MKIVLVFAAFVAIAVAAAEGGPTPVPILQYDEKRDEFGQFYFIIVTGDGQKFTRQGVLKPTEDGKDYYLAQSGSQTYTAPDGSTITLVWTADENGYVAFGDHLPVDPTTPSSNLD